MRTMQVVHPINPTYPTIHPISSQLEQKEKTSTVCLGANQSFAAKQILLGSLSYNGQRCTACKLILAHTSVMEALADKIVAGVSALKKGLPWEGANITPLPEPTKPKYLKDLVADAVAKGAKVVNASEGGGECFGNLYMPAVLSSVTSDMRIFNEEQFGPVVPIASFDDVSEVIKAAKESWNGQQAAIFSKDGASAAPLVDALSSIVGRINLNAQCSRGPDVFPFSGRRSSAMGTMSVTEALRAFSVEVLVAFPDNEDNRKVASEVEERTQFLQPLSAM